MSNCYCIAGQAPCCTIPRDLSGGWDMRRDREMWAESSVVDQLVVSVILRVRRQNLKRSMQGTTNNVPFY